MKVDTLRIDAVVADDFTSTLTDLADSLIDIDRIAAATVEDNDANVDIARAIANLQTLETRMDAIDRDINVGVDADGRNDIFDPESMPFSRLDDAETASVLDMESGFGSHVPTASADDGGDSGGGTTASADGGDDDGGIDLRRTLRAAQRNFGDAVDASVIADDADRVRRMSDLLGDKPSEFIDVEGMVDALESGRLDTDTLENLRSRDTDTASDAFRTLRRMGLTDLPTERGGILDRFEDIIGNFDATTLNNLRASLFPLLATFIGALPAAIAGIVALGGAALTAAAALGGVFGVGALGVALSDDTSLSELFTDLRDSFTEAFEPIASTLAPTFERAIESLQGFVDRLGESAQMLRVLADDALAFLDTLEGGLIQTFEQLVGLAMLTIDLFGSLGGDLANISIEGALASVLATTLDDLILFANAVIRLAPLILHLSEGFLLFTSGMLSVIGVIGSVLTQFPLLTQFIGVMIAGILTVVSATSLWIAATSLLSGTALAGLAKTLVGTVVAIGGLIKTMIGAIASTYGLAAAGLTLLTVITALTLGAFGVAAAVGVAANEFDILGGKIDSATGKLKRFQRAARRGRGGQFAMGVSNTARNSGGGTYVDYTEQNVTIRAPDSETGSKVARKHEYAQSIAEKNTT